MRQYVQRRPYEQPSSSKDTAALPPMHSDSEANVHTAEEADTVESDLL